MYLPDDTEGLEDKRKRHIKESEEQIDGWKRELEFSIKRNDLKYKEFCEMMISIWENTLTKLNNFKID